MQSFNLIEMWHSMAPLAKAVNVLLGICSVYSLWVIVDRSVALRSVRKKSVKFVVALREQLRLRNLDGAMQLATRENDSPVSRLVHEAFTEFREGAELVRARGDIGDYDAVEAVERVVDRTKEREVADLKRGLGGLASISSAAPFIGLFGTVVGIINAFRAMAATGQGGLGAVSAGISEALFTTAVGLSVAIPAVMTFNYFSTQIDRYVVDMNGIGSELISFVLREGHGAPAVQGHAPPAHRPHMQQTGLAQGYGPQDAYGAHPSQSPSQHPPPMFGHHQPSAHRSPSQHPPSQPMQAAHARNGYPPGYPR